MQQAWGVAAAMIVGSGCVLGGESVGVQQATVETTNGMPRLMINGRPTVPLVFFHNTDIPGDESDRHLRQQVALAKDAGVHIYSLPLRCPRQPDGVTMNWEHPDGLMDRFIAVDPEALFILRVYPGPNWSWKAMREKSVPHGQYVRFADGSSPGLSIASEYFRKGSNDELAEVVSHYEASEYAHRIVAWQPGGPYHEMFLADYRRSGPDYSEANEAAFREWLTKTHGSDEALQQAWGRNDVTLGTAGVPRAGEGRFPMRQGAGGSPMQVLYGVPREQDWVDFSAYMSDITADRIIEWARIVKEASGGRRLSAFFYGYTFDLPGSIAGHYALGRVLDSEDVDILASPYSYADRFAGGAGNFMCPVDSITARGKLWFTEDDTRTSLIDAAGLPEHFALFDRQCVDLDETLGVLGRNLASAIAHRAGTWWMDLVSRGAFNDPAPWALMRERKADYETVYEEPMGYRPEVGVIIDEVGKLYVKDDWDANWWMMYHLRDEVAKAGVAVGYYLLEDFVNGTLPECKLYLFANAFRLTEGQVEAIHARLGREGSTALWIYAPGYVEASVESVTGIAVRADEGRLGSAGEGLLEGEAWGPGFTVTPRVVVTDGRTDVLGRYREDAQVSAARSGRSILLCDWGPTRSMLRTLFAEAGCHVWTSGGEVVQTDGHFLAVHSGPGGDVEINVPDGLKLEPANAGPFRRGETRWFRLVGRP